MIKSGHLGKGLTFRQPSWKSSSELMIKIIMYFLHLCTVRQNVSHNQLTINIFYRGKKNKQKKKWFHIFKDKKSRPKSKNNWVTQLHNYYHNWKETAHFQFAKFCWRCHILPTSFWILTSTACCDKGNNDCWASAIKRLHF